MNHDNSIVPTKQNVSNRSYKAGLIYKKKKKKQDIIVCVALPQGRKEQSQCLVKFNRRGLITYCTSTITSCVYNGIHSILTLGITNRPLTGGMLNFVFLQVCLADDVLVCFDDFFVILVGSFFNGFRWMLVFMVLHYRVSDGGDHQHGQHDVQFILQA